MLLWKVVYKFFNRMFFSVFVYVFNVEEMRLFLWEELRRWIRNIYIFWIVVGDFNIFFDFKER